MLQFLILLLSVMKCYSESQCMPKDCMRPGHHAKSCFCSCLQPDVDDKRKVLYVSFSRCINATISCGFYKLSFRLNIVELQDDERNQLTSQILFLHSTENSFIQKFRLDNSILKTSLGVDRSYIITVTPNCTICDFCAPLKIELEAKHTVIPSPTTQEGQNGEPDTKTIIAVVFCVCVCVIIGAVIFVVIFRRSHSRQRHIVSQTDNFLRS